MMEGKGGEILRNLHPLAKVALALAASFLFLWLFNPFLNSPVGGSGGDKYELTVDEKIEVARRAGYEEGYEDGFDQGHSEGYDEGHEDGYLEGNESGYRDGYEDGYHDGTS